ncbi:signal peptidase I [Enterococcus termitis]|nr:signal peptidase I [Enterococcus termitis]
MKKNKKTTDCPYIKDFFIACFCVLLLLSIVILIQFKGTRIHGYAMIPTLHNGDLVVAKKTKQPKRFDLIVFKIGEKQQVRRVIGLADETIQYNDDILLVNGEPVDEKFIVDEINESQYNGKNYTENFFSGELNGSKIIPKGYCLVLGDNRPYATDSRHYGLIATRNIIGVIKLKLLPVNDLTRF